MKNTATDKIRKMSVEEIIALTDEDLAELLKPEVKKPATERLRTMPIEELNAMEGKELSDFIKALEAEDAGTHFI